MSSKRNQTIPNQTKSVATLHKYTKCIPKPLYPWDVDNIHPNFWDFYTFCTRFQKKNLKSQFTEARGQKGGKSFFFLDSFRTLGLFLFSENFSDIVSCCSSEAICVEHSKQCPEFSWDPRPLKFSDLKDHLWTIPKMVWQPCIEWFLCPLGGKIHLYQNH